MTFLVWLSFVAAVLFGIWLGRPRRYDQSLEEIEKRLLEEGNKHRTAKRHMTFLNMLSKNPQSESDRRFREQRTPFKM